MTATIERHEFQAEAKQLLDLMIHSVYSNKDIFLRELISNASDAIDKRRVLSLSDEKIGFPSDPEIRIETDPENRTVSIIDSGVGMSRSEVVEYVGTLAKSGTKEFLAQLKESREAPSAELIGQFGVGFYSAFLVADRVDLTTRRAGEEHATRWQSSGDGTYTLAESERDEVGTTITLHLKKVDEEDGIADYTQERKIREIVKQYSDFVTYPIRMDVERTEGSGDDQKTVQTTETLNSMKAIWARSPEDVTEEEYTEFYKHVSHDWTEPLTHIRYHAEGTLEYTMLLYVPSSAPYDLFHFHHRRGVNLYVKRIFIMDDCEDLVPTHLRFIKGVVDSEDLSLNISREILQQDRQIKAMRKQLEKKVLSELDKMKREDGDKFGTFWKEFGKVLKEGIMDTMSPSENAEKILSLCLFESTNAGTESTSLSDYVSRMKPGQDKIYYVTGENRSLLESSPQLEAYKAKGYEVLLLTDPVDEIWTGAFPPKYQEHEFESVAKGAGELGTEDERKKEEEALEEKKKTFASLLEAVEKHLDDDVKDVRLSKRLTESPACLVGDESDMTPQMEQMLKAMGRDPGKQKRILELNPDHPVMKTLQSIFEKDANDPRIADYAQLVYGQAVLAEGGKLENPAKFTKLLTDLLTKAL
ncbi:MAG: molecular chaperone HtpG [Candidatus Eisenbacteria bacterium]